MPNHCSNYLTLSGTKEDIATIKSLCIKEVNKAGEDSKFFFDFNGIIPMPEELKIEASPIGYRGEILLTLPPLELATTLSTLAQFDLIFRELPESIDLHTLTIAGLITLLEADPDMQEKGYIDLKLGKQYVDNMRKYGSPTWYEWSHEHWGTSWNAYHCDFMDMDEESIETQFDTAWSPPESVYAELIRRFPSISLKCHYIDENNLFAGTFESCDGSLNNSYYVDEEVENYFMQEVFGWEPPEDEDESS